MDVCHYGLADDTCGYECQECTGYGDPVVGIQASRSLALSIVLNLYSSSLLRSIAQILGFQTPPEDCVSDLTTTN